ncbi:MAG: ABC transporter substrate-binding protein [Candidatus Nitrosoabyssus spongiisocia]|nr:MAG: ABC transporter substrate-binding protein [Nitrosopumilaceae archaeon AB1(1)]
MDSGKKIKVGIGIAIIIIIIIGAALVVMEFIDNVEGITGLITSSVINEGITGIIEGSELMGDVSIGVLLPLTGDLSSHGTENFEAARFGVITFNEHLDKINAPWDLIMVGEDSATNPVIALEKITSLNAKGIGVVVGVETSSNIKNVKGYTDANNMLIVSCCSTAPALAIANDSVYRLAPDDRNQGIALSKLVKDAGIENMIIVWRGDVWGDGLSKATKEAFQERGGIVTDDIRYNPESPEFSASVSLLAEQVQDSVDEYGVDNVAIVYLAFGEVLQFMQSAASHDILDDVRWFGPDAYTRDYNLINDPIGAKFAETVQLTTVLVGSSDNDVVKDIDNYVMSTLGRAPNTYAYSDF